MAQHLYRIKKSASDLTEEDKKTKKKQLTEGLPFELSWYPPEWLVWFCYGPPSCNGASEFAGLQMDHLHQVTSITRGMTHEEEVQEMGKMDKRVRKIAKRKASDADDVNDDMLSVSQARTITFVREEKRRTLTRSEKLDNFIRAKNAQLQLLLSLGGEGNRDLQVTNIRNELFELLQQMYDACVADLNDDDEE